MLIILVGLPSVGKSTFARRLSKELYLRGVDNVVIGSDVIRECFPVWKREYESYIREATYQLIDRALREFYVIVDDTNYYNSKRRDLINIAKRRNKDYRIIYLKAPLEVILERNKRRGEKVPNELIVEMYRKFDEPGKRYTWDKPEIVIDTSKEIDFNRVIDTILNRSTRKSRNEKDRGENDLRSKTWNRIDKITREVVGEYIRSRSIDKKDIKVILEFRKKFLKNLRSKDLEEIDEEELKKDFKRFLDNNKTIYIKK
ncbi:MAG TPA: L-seryl-tRNA(Sec) kinase [Methanococcaceae archaeon]|uniref:L-seryl-tRNA(Sec) kinase n=1 Tax=Methanothermococcus okinawensis TaxID=155863 RepID=A0A833E461_9EURY|nr:L-seryl-tRNA(Sec) kinase [Methanococcaceae archaeon]HIP91432.1 L-seryl-tRNA(Sec) kinase [Methanothermococcus okinawensis]